MKVTHKTDFGFNCLWFFFLADHGLSDSYRTGI